MKYLNAKLLATIVFGLTLLSCNDDDAPIVEMVNVPSSLSINDKDFFPEDVVYANKTIYVSGFGDGTIKAFDLMEENPMAKEFAAKQEGYFSSWGLATDGKVVLNIVNNPNFGDIMNNGASKLVAYNTSGVKTAEWDLPANTIGNSVQIVDGKYYVCDWNPTARIIQIDPKTNTVNPAWYTNTTEWDPTKGGLGGVIYNENGGFYIAQNGKFWYLPISNGTPGALQEVRISGIENIDADGITWAGNNTLYYAENDATDTSGANGKVYKVVFNNTTTATGTVFKSGLNDSSGVWFFEANNKDYLIVLESQIGVFFGNSIDLPFNIQIIEL